MQIKTITCHDVYNYGASLQAYALQHYLESLGHEVEIIDFKPWFQRGRYNFWYVSQDSKYYRLCKKFPIIRFLYCLRRYRGYPTIGRKRPFDDFKRKYLKLTSQTYHDSEKLKLAPPVADMYIAGSDQIWNTDSNNGKEPAYYLDFGDDKTKRVSYAASFAVSEIRKEFHDFVKAKLSRFDVVSVREKTGLSVLEALGIRSGIQVLDPVFLLEKKQWESLPLKRMYKEPYVLVYDFLHDDPKLTKTVKKIARDKQLKIVSINDIKNLAYADINVSDAGPIEFLSLTKYANYVVANSFHATAFSIIFQRPFLTFPLRSQKNSSRMKDFLASVNLLDFFDSDYNNTCVIDFARTDEIIQDDIERSRNYLISLNE